MHGGRGFHTEAFSDVLPELTYPLILINNHYDSMAVKTTNITQKSTITGPCFPHHVQLFLKRLY